MLNLVGEKPWAGPSRTWVRWGTALGLGGAPGGPHPWPLFAMLPVDWSYDLGHPLWLDCPGRGPVSSPQPLGQWVKKETRAQRLWQGSVGSVGANKPFQLCGHIWG